MNLLHHHPVHVHLWNPVINRNGRCLGRGVLNLKGKPDRERARAVSVGVAARDRVIDFGKYKGKMLGSLPSRYLKWVSNNLRAGEFEEWANLADQVLRDPIYRDRIEWEFAQNVLNGNGNRVRSFNSTSAVSELMDISERFGWDNLDKVGWSKVDFDLLGTSKAARIPRLLNANPDPNPNLMDTQSKHKHKHKHTPSLSVSTQWERRMERRERHKNKNNNTMGLRLRLTTQAQQHHHQQQQKNKNMIHMNMDDVGNTEEMGHNQNNGIPNPNPFPGRQALLRKAINHRTRTSFVSPK